MTPEEIMKKFANEHSYESWGELMYDTHEHIQIEYTKEVMELYHEQFDMKKELAKIDETNSILFEFVMNVNRVMNIHYTFADGENEEEEKLNKIKSLLDRLQKEIKI